jgi:hypothetical protein
MGYLKQHDDELPGPDAAVQQMPAQVAAADVDAAAPVPEVQDDVLESGARAQDPQGPAGEEALAQPKIVRTADEVQRAHDILVEAMINGELCAVAFKGAGALLDLECVKANVDVLCWLLGHNHNRTFTNNLSTVETACEIAGYELLDKGHLESRK